MKKSKVILSAVILGLTITSQTNTLVALADETSDVTTSEAVTADTQDTTKAVTTDNTETATTTNEQNSTKQKTNPDSNYTDLIDENVGLRDTYEAPRALVLVPGLGGTVDTYDYMAQNILTHTTMNLVHVYVQNDGTVRYTKPLNMNTDQTKTIFMMGFENNGDALDNLKIQTNLFNKGMKSITENYGITDFDAVGYSNGGIVLTRYLENDYQDNTNVIHNFVSIATPYNNRDNTTTPSSAYYEDMTSKSSSLPYDMNVTNIIGLLTPTSDGYIPRTSAESGKGIFEGHVESFEQVYVEGQKASHGKNVNNPETWDIIENIVRK
ncbi:alpha/beta hydrolase [Lactobacillus terrae]|uniref:alpha/beta hydrolase n=1 Tax=Lactobacillus terrae TaxID=2269374 RepID=UPI0014755DB5|nr:alpha/beta hydrolase [Lactobacillus terrae]